MKFRGAYAWAACLLLIARAYAQDEQPATPDGKALREKWQQIYQKIAGSIEMHRGQTPLKLEPAPLLFYTNPVRLNQQHGSIFLWTCDRGTPGRSEGKYYLRWRAEEMPAGLAEEKPQ